MDSEVGYYYNQAKNYCNIKDYNQALEQIKKAILIDNHDYDCWCLITEIYLALNRIDEASSCAITLLNLNSNNPQSWHLRARVLLGLMRYDEALQASDKSLQLDGANPEYLQMNKNIKKYLDFRKNNQNNSNQSIPHEESDSANSNNSNHADSNNSNQADSNNSNWANSGNSNPANSEESYSSNSNEEIKIPSSGEETFNPINKYESIFQVTSISNIALFKQKKLNSRIYYNLLDDLMDGILRKVDKDSEDSLYAKITQFVSCFAEIQYDSINHAEGLYSCNVIKIDEKGETIKNIATLIHELAHHLFSEIFELSLMYLFDSEKTDAIEALAWYSLNFKETYHLSNEYCAHTVENYFMPAQYNNFESFNRVLKNFDLSKNEDMENIYFAAKLGNTFAQDIIYMLNQFFDDKLKREIKKQFISDGYVFCSFGGTEFKTYDFFDDVDKFNQINLILSESIIYIKNHFAIFDLINYKNVFSKVNKRFNYSI